MSKVIWRIPAEENLSLEAVTRGALRFGDQFANSLIPVVEGAANPKEELIVLLKIAAEVEHALMLQYLYAAYSIADELDPIRESLLTVSKQEMGHFLAVQNLLLSIGGIGSLHLHLNRFRPTDIDDNPLPYTLEPLSQELLAKFVAVEAPIIPAPDLKTEMEDIRKVASENGTIRLNPVGGLYMKIFWIFQPDDTPVADLTPLLPDPQMERHPAWHLSENDYRGGDEIAAFEARRSVWSGQAAFTSNNLSLSQVRNSREALELVHFVSAQGEGADFTDEIESHFETFLNVYRTFDPAATRLLDLPLNPITVPNPEFKSVTKIENEYSRLWISLLNEVYNSLLLDIHASMFYTQFSEDGKTSFVRVIFICMTSCLKPLSDVIVRLPRLDGVFQYDADPRCGPTFEIADDFILSASMDEMDDLNLRYLDQIMALSSAIREHPNFEDHLTAEESNPASNSEGLLGQISSYCSLKRALFTN